MKRVDLVIPGLLNLPVNELNIQALSQNTPFLHQLLRFADQIPSGSQDIDQILIQRLGLNQAGLPYAKAVKPDTADSISLLFKPVHLKADINNAIVFPLVIDDEIEQIINDLAVYFEVNCKIESLQDNTWLMTLQDCQPILGVPHYLSVLGKKINQSLEVSRQHLQWFKLFNEMQMYLHQHEINRQRQQQGLPVVNSLWCWGADDYRGETFNRINWISDDYLMASLGELFTGQSQPLTGWRETKGNFDTIIIELSLLKALKGEVHGDLNQRLVELESTCIRPVMAQSQVNEIVLHTAASMNFHYRPGHRWKLWKKPRTLVDMMD